LLRSCVLSHPYSVLAEAKRQCSRVPSSWGALSAPWSLPAFENIRSTPADEAGR
jgi:hypothetical protein